jgi:hypothetical protein
MDATRSRRTRDGARQAWYAARRQWRFARRFGLAGGASAPGAFSWAAAVVSVGPGTRLRPLAMAGGW